ncbi:hypothetical protein NEUTE1DRAFT_39302 [Neurospora tetrasperma FGSC 2508]|uniref:Uncharacterized protein n=1 Tax=Neurospora tetrasperma (strain FGSC 2508 / ATCC MYA-4615 / P0657) TaxID=510951 RepID=F8MHQ5_NEUT8|nr:uncharacterized protein NEUTE1DRAFT_39302 [Neurospora tetrasperma FGSC 2508]EGO59666.1 hypothetical protein NEUTE1DRAFT_39302 [Neurospora tetrasperma FGSC 2508]EGZ73801.1 hypothetical protein NEUTE2DRAFT_62909 [Neurospora tetrasperma FGSC 2509]
MYGRTGEFVHMNDLELSSKEKSPMMGETVDPQASRPEELPKLCHIKSRNRSRRSPQYTSPCRE